MIRSPSSILLFEEAQKRGFRPIWKTDYGFFTFIFKRKTIYVYQTKNYGNNQLSTWLTTDKYATRLILGEHRLPNIPYFYSNKKNELTDFFDAYHPLIAKPVLGEMAKNVVLITHKEELNAINLEETIVEKFIEGDEYRVMVLKGEIVAVQKKQLDPIKKYPWRKKRVNLTRDQWNIEMVNLSKKIQSIIPQTIMAVDVIQDTHGKIWILELNSMPGFWSFNNPHSGEPINLAPIVLDIIIETQLKP